MRCRSAAMRSPRHSAAPSLAIKPDLIATNADDWLGNMFGDMAAKYDVHLHIRKVEKSSLSFIMPKDGKRAIVRCRDDHYLTPFPVLEMTGCRALHLDGHQADAAMFYAKACRKAGILTSLDGGGLRTNTHELLGFIDVAMVAERFCQQMDKTPEAMIDYLKSRGVQGRRRDARRARRAVVRRERRRAEACGAGVPAKPRARHQRGRRCVPRRLCVSRICGIRKKAGEQHLQFASHAAALQGPASRQRGRLADAQRCGSGGSGVSLRPTRHARRATVFRRCGPAADRCASSSSRSGQRRLQFGCSVTVPGTLGWSFSSSTSSMPMDIRRVGVSARNAATASKPICRWPVTSLSVEHSATRE